MYQPLIKFHPHPAIFTQVLRIFGGKKCADYGFEIRAERIAQALGNC